mgnify:FL=1
MERVFFRATQHDTRTDKIMKVAAKVENVGFAVTISFNTEQRVTPEYLEKMAKEIEELPPVNFRYFKNARPIRSENFA